MRQFEPEHFDPPEGIIESVGRTVLLTIRNAGKALVILGAAFLRFPELPKRRKEFGRQLYLCGVKSFGVTATVALFTGMILSLQAGLILRDYSQQARVGTLVAQTMCREMGPFMTALILAASVGSAMAAELAAMTVSEEVSALEVMSINPVSFLVAPRIAAMMIMCPALTVFTDIVGTLGGMLVAYTQLGVSVDAYYKNAVDYLANYEVYVGLFKSLVFAAIVSAVACYQGLAATEGAVGVGRATRKTVVHSFLLVLIVGYFITRFFADGRAGKFV